jgi:hypothetical protein
MHYYVKVSLFGYWYWLCALLIGWAIIILQIHRQMNIFDFPDWIMVFWVTGISLVFSLLLNIPLWPEREEL